jgi:hypothetical protein
VKDLVAINIDVPTAVATALRALPAILALRGDVIRELPCFDIGNFDQLETYARAAEHAYAQRVEPSAAADVLASLRERGKGLGSTLHREARILLDRGLIPSLCAFNGRANAKQLGDELLAISQQLRQHWETIASRTAIQLSELDQAERLAHQLLVAWGEKEQARTARAQEAELCQRHFTLFVRAYAQIRRAVAYLRWDRNPDKVAPSLYKARRAGLRKARQSKPNASMPVCVAGQPTS